MSLMRDRLVSVIFLLFSGLIIVISFTYLDKPSMIYFPLLFGGVTFFFSLFYILKGYFTKPLGSTETETPIEKSHQVKATEIQRDGENKAAIRLFAWLFGFILLASYINYVVLVPVFILLMLRFDSRTSWALSGFTAVGMGVFAYLLFYWFLRVRWAQFPF